MDERDEPADPPPAAAADLPDAWERRDRESDQAWQAFTAYRDQGPGRTLAAAAKAVGKSERLMRKWSQDKDWVDRCRAFDNYVDQVETAARIKVRAKRAAKWEQRKLEESESAFSVAMKLRERAEQMLARPLETKKLDKDGKTIIVKPANWTFATAGNMAKASVELAAMVIDLALGEDEDFDPLTATPEQCRDHIARQQAQRAALRDAVNRRDL